MVGSKPLFAVLSILAALFANAACKDEPSVIIVGAGAAGIAAASKLLENNITNIVILEAEGRIGGRIHTVEFGDGVADLGAQACAGADSSFVYNMVKSYDLLEPIDASKRIYQSPSGERLDQEFTNKLEKLFVEVYKITPQNVVDDLSLGELVKKEYKKSITSQFKSDAPKLKLASSFIDLIEKEYLIYGGGSSWLLKSAKAEIERPLVNKAYEWKGHGFKALLDFMIKRQPSIEGKIMLNKHVDKIHWKDQVSVHCSDGSTYKADHIILTVSVGVLKDNVNSLFDPQLPPKKVEAIKDIGLCSGVKAFLHFSKRWWPTDAFSVGLVWPTGEPENALITNSGHPWISNFYGFYTDKHNPNVLEAWFTGPEAQNIELLSDEEFLNGIMFSLKTFFGQSVTKPDHVLRSKWYSNPNFRGTYSYDTIDSYKSSSRKALVEPLSGADGKLSLLFSGEATSITCYGMVDGAVESGFDEAQRIITHHK